MCHSFNVASKLAHTLTNLVGLSSSSTTSKFTSRPGLQTFAQVSGGDLSSSSYRILFSRTTKSVVGI